MKKIYALFILGAFMNPILAQTECTSATAITSLDCTSPTSYDVGALSTTISFPGCANSSYAGDSWYSFVSDGTEATINIDNGANGGDVSVAIYSGCTAGDLIQCTNNDSGALSTDDESMTITTLTDGQTYYVRIMSQEKSNGNPKYYGTGTLCIDQSPYTLSGTATPTGTDGCVQLTTAGNDQSGCAWSDEPFDFNSDFDIEYTVNLGSDDAGADGLTFVIQNSAAGTNAGCGGTGGGIGAEGITPSLIIEFDTWQNGAGEAENLPWEPTYDHIAVETDGTLIHDGYGNSAPAFGPVQASSTSTNIEDGADHTVRLVWDASSETFTIYFDGAVRLSFTIDLVALFGSNTAYWGFTASTGGAVNNQSFCPGTLPGFALGINSVKCQVSCNDNSPQVIWATLEETNIDNYLIEQTLNGKDYTVIKRVKAHNLSKNTYSFTDHSLNASDAYYRIKSVDLKGNERIVSSLLSSSCNSIDQTNFTVFGKENEIEIQFSSNFSKKYTLRMYDMRGRLVWENTGKSNKGENTIKSNLSELSKSIYIVHYFDEQTSFSKKFVLR